MISVGEHYRPTGHFDVRSVLVTLILGTTTALIGAGLIWLWEISPIPTLVILTPILQGVFVGVALAFMVGRLKMRNPALVGTIGFACGLLSVLLVHYGHHLRLVSTVESSLRNAIAAQPAENAEQGARRQDLLARLDRDPASVVDPMLRQKTGHAGFVGTMILRNQEGVKIKSSQVTGWPLWGLWAVEGLLVAGIAAASAAGRASEPFCEECGFWCAKEPDVFTVSAGHGARLVEAIREDRPATIQELRAVPGRDDASGLTSVTLNVCPQCDQAFAVVSQRIQTGKETKTTALLTNLRISPALVAALLCPPPVASEEPEPTEAPAG